MDNPQDDAKVALGHQLFFDKRLSVDGTRACYSCHMNEDGNGGHDPLAIGPGDKVLTRHSPVIWNVAFLSELYWDGRAKSLEEQGTAAWAGGNMGVGKENLEKKAAEIAAIAGYKTQFDAVFPGEGVTPTNIIKAISSYERTLACEKTAYDRYETGADLALSREQKKGLELFMGKAACVVCHAPPHFSTAYGGAGRHLLQRRHRNQRQEGRRDRHRPRKDFRASVRLGGVQGADTAQHPEERALLPRRLGRDARSGSANHGRRRHPEQESLAAARRP